MVKKLLAPLFAVLLLASLLCGCASVSTNATASPATAAQTSPSAESTTRIVATMYPMYILLSNLAADVDGVTIECLTPPTGGCLHDYQLTTADMKVLDAADILIANGAGMEPFLADITPQFPNLTVLQASDGYPLLGDDATHPNAHVWVSPAGAIYQCAAVSQALAELLPAYAADIRQNAQTYTDKLTDLQQRMQAALAPYAGLSVATLHNSFDYLMDEFGIQVAAVLMVDDETDPTPEQLEDSIAAIRAQDARVILMEPQFSDALCQTVSRETGVPVAELDTLATGDLLSAQNAYLDGMEKNLTVLLQALAQPSAS